MLFSDTELCTSSGALAAKVYATTEYLSMHTRFLPLAMLLMGAESDGEGDASARFDGQWFLRVRGVHLDTVAGIVAQPSFVEAEADSVLVACSKAEMESLAASAAVDVLARDLGAFLRRRSLMGIETAGVSRRRSLAASWKFRRGWYQSWRKMNEIVTRIEEVVQAGQTLLQAPAISEIGKSAEGRAIHGVRIGNRSAPLVLLACGVHSREWVSFMVCPYIIEKTVFGLLNNETEVLDLMSRVQLALIPIVNPDGFEFTYASGGNRMWRKSRRPAVELASCGGGDVGIDLNRNWDAPGWFSSGLCQSTYSGTAAFSEPETAAVKEYIASLGSEPVLGFDLHTYGRLLAGSWAYTNADPPNVRQMDRVGNAMKEAIKRRSGRN